MKIIGIEVFHIRVPLRKPFGLSKVLGTLTYTQPIIIKVFTDEGIIGLGEADPMVPFTEESPESVKECLRHYLAPATLGADPTNIAAVNGKMDKILKLNELAKGALDMACHDILGKAKGLPVYQLLGGCLRKEIPLAWGIGAGTPEENVKEVEEKVTAGRKTFMIKTAGLTLEEDIARVRAVREAFPDIHLLADANQGWDRSSALRFARAVAGCHIDFLEQPVPYWDIEGLAMIRKSTSIPVSVDETLCTIHDAVRVLREGAADVFSVKASKNGGIYKAKQILDLAKAYGIRCWLNSMIEEGITQAALLHLGVSAENILDLGHALFSPTRLEDDVTTYSEQIKGSVVRINDKPGLGIEIREDVLRKYTIDVFQIKA
jgi:muconate cycloisomerase